MENNPAGSDVTVEDGYLADAQVADEDVPLDEGALYPLEGGADRRYATLGDINDEAISLFHEQGYLVVDNGLDAETLDGCNSGLDDLIDGKFEGFRSVMVEAGARESFKTMDTAERREVVRKVFNFVGVEPRLTALSEHSGILDVVRRIMDDEPTMLQDMALLKPARIGREKAWHQDCAYFDVNTDTTVVGVWIALDAATLENGCLHVIPGSHHQGPHPHFKVRDWQICDTDVQAKDSIPIPLEPGGILFWHGLTHHGSPSNRSDKGRRGIQLHYQPENVSRMTKEERLGIYGGEGLGMTC